MAEFDSVFSSEMEVFIEYPSILVVVSDSEFLNSLSHKNSKLYELLRHFSYSILILFFIILYFFLETKRTNVQILKLKCWKKENLCRFKCLSSSIKCLFSEEKIYIEVEITK